MPSPCGSLTSEQWLRFYLHCIISCVEWLHTLWYSEWLDFKVHYYSYALLSTVTYLCRWFVAASKADVPFFPGSRTVYDLSCQILKATVHNNWTSSNFDKFKFNLYCYRRSLRQYVLVSCLFWRPWPDCDFMSLTITFFVLHVGHPLSPEDGYVIYSAITYWLESHRTYTHVLLSHLRPQPGGPGSHIYIPHKRDSPVILPGTGFRFRCLLRFAGPRPSYSSPPQHEVEVTLWLTVTKSKSQYNWRSASHYVKVSSQFWDLWPDITFGPMFFFFSLKFAFLSLRGAFSNKRSGLWACVKISRHGPRRKHHSSVLV
jgi:hypothetical protein